MESITEASRQTLLLQAWEAVSTERELPGVLASIAELLARYVDFDAISLIRLAAPDDHDRMLAFHIPGMPRAQGESLQDFAERSNFKPEPLEETRPLIPYPPYEQTRVHMLRGEPFVCPDLLERTGWYEHDFQLARAGIRAYCSLPIALRGEVLGVAPITRIRPGPFSPDELAILQAICRPLSVAVANALANEEIRKLRDQLEAENLSLRSQLGQTPWFDEIVAQSEPSRRVLAQVEQVASTDATVLVTGETGTGKELIVRALHRRSTRARGPLVKVNCAAIPDTLIASELFGHERGAFTGAHERRKGRFEQAHGGTLFLDEIGELAPEMQVLLLRVLQEREFERLGGTQTLQVDVRLIAATNRDLQEEVRRGRFRSDLFHRLNVFPIRIPPLRERTDEIPVLVAHFAQRYAERFGRNIEHIDRKSLEALVRYPWPGNVRELENAVERSVILADRGILALECPTPIAADSRSIEAPKTLNTRLNSAEREQIEAALAASAGRIAGPNGAAARLGIPASTVEFRIKKLGINKLSYRPRI